MWIDSGCILCHSGHVAVISMLHLRSRRSLKNLSGCSRLKNNLCHRNLNIIAWKWYSYKNAHSIWYKFWYQPIKISKREWERIITWSKGCFHNGITSMRCLISIFWIDDTFFCLYECVNKNGFKTFIRAFWVNEHALSAPNPSKFGDPKKNQPGS